MKLFLILICFILSLSTVNGQSKMTVYFLPGQGSDQRLFDSLALQEGVRVKFLQYDTITSTYTMSELAKKLALKIDTTETFALVGVSLGGMLCVELAELLHPHKTIIISSAKNRNDFPFRYRFQKTIPLYAVFPSPLIRGGAKMLQPLVEPDRRKNKNTFKKMLRAKKSTYYKRSVKMIIKWERTENAANIIHIQGDNDHTLPLRKMQLVNYVVPNGSHMMTLTRAKEISVILNRELSLD